ncbi:MAG: protein kinase [Desulfobacterales bacterium]|jgi:serine/threonine-protein kinase
MKTIGRYRIRGLLGRGGMSRVFKVELPVIGKVAALKLLDPNPVLVDLIGLENIREMFVAEAVTMANLRHPNLVEIWDFDESQGNLFYLMDFYFNNLGIMIGETYQTEKPSRVISIEKAIHYIRQTLEGLAALHHAGIIHRDIKPFNILVTEQDTVKICDFGLSKLRGETFQGPPNLKVGSPWYAAPEQEAEPDTVDFSADLYSVGITLYRMLTGSLPRENAADPSRLNPNLDSSWDQFLDKATAARRRDRFQRAKEMLTDLDMLQASWEEKKKNTCRLIQDDQPPVQMENNNRTTGKIRGEPLKLNPQQGKRIFMVDDLWRPRNYVQNDYDTHTADIVADWATGLVWQQSGSEYPLTWLQAADYIKGLNQRRFGKRHTWRLPTVNELGTLLIPTPQGEDYCIEPVFDLHQKWLWSCDRRSYAAAWYVSIDMGFIGWQDLSGLYYVRAVSSI